MHVADATCKYHSLAKEGPWAVHLTLGSDRRWADICDISFYSYR